MILPKAPCIPDVVTCSMPTVALRFPSHPVARALISACGFPLAAPSANRSGTPSPTTASHVMHDFNGIIDGVVECGQSAVGVESTVITLCTPHPLLLRPGFGDAGGTAPGGAGYSGGSCGVCRGQGSGKGQFSRSEIQALCPEG